MAGGCLIEHKEKIRTKKGGEEQEKGKVLTSNNCRNMKGADRDLLRSRWRNTSFLLSTRGGNAEIDRAYERGERRGGV